MLRQPARMRFVDYRVVAGNRGFSAIRCRIGHKDTLRDIGSRVEIAAGSALIVGSTRSEHTGVEYAEHRGIRFVVGKFARIRIEDSLVRIEPVPRRVNVGNKACSAAAARPGCIPGPVRAPEAERVQNGISGKLDFRAPDIVSAFFHPVVADSRVAVFCFVQFKKHLRRVFGIQCERDTGTVPVRARFPDGSIPPETVGRAIEVDRTVGAGCGVRKTDRPCGVLNPGFFGDRRRRASACSIDRDRFYGRRFRNGKRPGIGSRIDGGHRSVKRVVYRRTGERAAHFNGHRIGEPCSGRSELGRRNGQRNCAERNAFAGGKGLRRAVKHGVSRNNRYVPSPRRDAGNGMQPVRNLGFNVRGRIGHAGGKGNRCTGNSKTDRRRRNLVSQSSGRRKRGSTAGCIVGGDVRAVDQKRVSPVLSLYNERRKEVPVCIRYRRHIDLMDAEQFVEHGAERRGSPSDGGRILAGIDIGYRPHDNAVHIRQRPRNRRSGVYGYNPVFTDRNVIDGDAGYASVYNRGLGGNIAHSEAGNGNQSRLDIGNLQFSFGSRRFFTYCQGAKFRSLRGGIRLFFQQIEASGCCQGKKSEHRNTQKTVWTVCPECGRFIVHAAPPSIKIDAETGTGLRNVFDTAQINQRRSLIQFFGFLSRCGCRFVMFHGTSPQTGVYFTKTD
ncbi:MAG: hypothetical protein BWY39_01961 [Spirochaetes bacterium ADurb.Bin269]|nr:MAG: hypothetical protein BWY39_01961 [Spirochaetes bacterium ADurb.Bin269]